MSKLRKRERGPEEGEASAGVAIVQNNGRLKLKVERGMAAPFIHNRAGKPRGNRRTMDDRPAMAGLGRGKGNDRKYRERLSITDSDQQPYILHGWTQIVTRAVVRDTHTRATCSACGAMAERNRSRTVLSFEFFVLSFHGIQ